MGTVAIAAAIMTGLGLLFSSLLATASRYLRVEEDPRVGGDPGGMPPGIGVSRLRSPDEGHRPVPIIFALGDAADGAGLERGLVPLEVLLQRRCDGVLVHINGFASEGR